MQERNLIVEEELEVKEFVKKVQGYDKPDHHTHLIPDFPNRRLGIYYHVGEAGSGRVIKTVLEGVRFRMNYDREVESWFFTFGETMNLLTWLNSYKWERTETRITMTAYPESRTFGKNTKEEAIYFKYRTESGNEQQVEVTKPYTNTNRMLANFK